MSDDADSSYEQGELEPSPDRRRAASEGDQPNSPSPHSQDAITIDDPDEQEFSDKER